MTDIAGGPDLSLISRTSRVILKGAAGHTSAKSAINKDSICCALCHSVESFYFYPSKPLPFQSSISLHFEDLIGLEDKGFQRLTVPVARIINNNYVMNEMWEK